MEVYCAHHLALSKLNIAVIFVILFSYQIVAVWYCGITDQQKSTVCYIAKQQL